MLLEPARRVVAAHALPPQRDEVRIVPAQHGADAGLLGAAALAIVELFPDESRRQTARAGAAGHAAPGARPFLPCAPGFGIIEEEIIVGDARCGALDRR